MPTISTFYDHIRDISAQKNIPFHQAMDMAHELGISALEVIYSSVKGRAKEVAKELSNAGMGVSAMPVFFGFDHDRDVRAQAIPALEDAKIIGAHTIMVIPGFISQDQDPEESTKQMVACTQELAELAREADIALVMEDFDNLSSPICTSKGMLRFLEAVDGLGACFDTGNFRIADEDPFEAYEALKGRIIHVHCKDRALSPEYGDGKLHTIDGTDIYPCPVGSGVMPMEALLEHLKADGYAGGYSIEHFGARDTLDCLGRSVEWLRGHI